jgi:hypothetical protein
MIGKNHYKALKFLFFMIIKIKRLRGGRISKMIAGGEIKEILVHTDLLSPSKEKISICFKGSKNSGIVELSDDEVDHLYKTIHSKIKLVKGVKIIKD